MEAIAAARPQALVVAAYGLILPPALLRLPPRGCLNVHASLLPRWRGAAPIQRALLAGDTQTGITIMQMDEGLDTGAILLQEPVAIRADDTAGTLHDKLAALGARLMVRALEAPPAPQRAGRQPGDLCRAHNQGRSRNRLGASGAGNRAPGAGVRPGAGRPDPSRWHRAEDLARAHRPRRRRRARARCARPTPKASWWRAARIRCASSSCSARAGSDFRREAFLSGFRLARGARFGTKHG